ncbi:NADPH:quinone oxidoreductase family protein [Maritalea sp.]|jgi:NADPH2:quinone reductase|uniref:NADPH:quinone oxidoreductase family protein n=1 Tax=Maritalea sp. TaxID=2003361 RepID=UPI0039E4411D
MKHWIAGEKLGQAGLNFGAFKPEAPAIGEMRVEVRAAALNFSDLLMIEDKYQIKPERPFVPGQEVAGIVSAIGASSKFKIGDRVASKVNWGGFSQSTIVREDTAFRLPDHISFADGAALPVAYMTAMVGLCELGKLSPGDVVLVHAAAGGVGLAAVQIAKANGAEIIATASSAAKLTLAKLHGADHTVSYASTDWFKQVKALTNGRGVDLIFDPVGGQIGTDSLRCIARDGKLLIVGFASGEIQKLPANRLLLKRAAAQGVYWSHDEDAEMLDRLTQRLLIMLEAGHIKPHTNTTYSLEQLPEALTALSNRSSRGKIILTVGDGNE